MTEFSTLVGDISNNSANNQISVADQGILDNALYRGGGEAVVPKGVFSRKMGIGPLSKHCYDNNILFKQAHQCYYFKQT